VPDIVIPFIEVAAAEPEVIRRLVVSRIRSDGRRRLRAGHGWRVGEGSTMRFRGAGRVYLLATIMVALAALNPRSQRIAVAQIPEAPGTFRDSNGDGLSDAPVEAVPPRKGAKPKSDEPAPDAPRDTIDEFERARERASGTPEPEPTPPGGFFGTE
jgi:hypothetical protein